MRRRSGLVLVLGMSRQWKRSRCRLREQATACRLARFLKEGIPVEELTAIAAAVGSGTSTRWRLPLGARPAGGAAARARRGERFEDRGVRRAWSTCSRLPHGPVSCCARNSTGVRARAARRRPPRALPCPPDFRRFARTRRDGPRVRPPPRRRTDRDGRCSLSLHAGRRSKSCCAAAAIRTRCDRRGETRASRARSVCRRSTRTRSNTSEIDVLITFGARANRAAETPRERRRDAIARPPRVHRATARRSQTESAAYPTAVVRILAERRAALRRALGGCSTPA